MAYIEGMGQRLKSERKGKYTQKQVAELIGVSATTVSSYERDIYLPPGDVLIKLSAIYRCTTDYLYGLSEAKTISIDGLDEEAMLLVTQLVNKLSNHK